MSAYIHPCFLHPNLAQGRILLHNYVSRICKPETVEQRFYPACKMRRIEKTDISDLVRRSLTVQPPQSSARYEHEYEEHERRTHQQKLHDVAETQTHGGLFYRQDRLRLQPCSYGSTMATMMMDRHSWARMVRSLSVLEWAEPAVNSIRIVQISIHNI